MIEINVMNKKENNLYEVIIRDRQIDLLKYGELYLYDCENKSVRVRDNEAQAALISSAILNQIDIIEMIDEAVKDHQERVVDVEDILNMFINAVV